MTARDAPPAPRRIVGLFPELLGVGGVQEAGRLTAAALTNIAKRRGWSIEFVSLNDSKGPNSFEVESTRVTFRGFARAKIQFVLDALRRARSAASDGPGIVLAAHPNLAVPAQWMRRVSPRLSTIVMSHGIEVWQPAARSRRKALANADIVLAPSMYTAQKLTEVQGVPARRVRKLAWPINPAFLRLAEEAGTLSRLPALPPAPVILAIARWAASERYKGADELIAAVSKLGVEVPDAQLVLVGSGDDLPRLRKLAADSGVSNRVHFLENLSRREIAACYAHADVFALPSSGEGFGIVFLEAMAFAKPVVAAAAGGATDIVQHEVNGLLVPPHDCDRLAIALARMLRDQALRKALGRRGLEIVREKYRFESFEKELETILTGSSNVEQTVAEARQK